MSARLLRLARLRPALLLPALLVGALLAPAARAAVVDKNSATLMTELVTHALGRERGFDVVSSADVRRQIELEASKQTLGCDATATSCLAEIAGAMGAQLVVSGQLGVLQGDGGDVVILTLSLFDSTQGRSVGRVALRDQTLAALSGQVDAGVRELVAPFTGAMTPTQTATPTTTPTATPTRTKVLVLDIAPPQNDGVANDAIAAAAPPLFIAGVSGLVGGGVVAGIGVVLFVLAQQQDKAGDSRELNAIEAEDAYDQRDGLGAAAVVAVVVGAVAAVAGGAAVALSE